MKKGKKTNKLKIFWKWLGKQNAYLVFGVFFLIIYGTTKTYAYFSSELNSNEGEIEVPPVKIIASPTSTPSPTRINQNSNSNLNIRYPTVITITPTPAIDRDPIIDCNRPNDCGGGTVKMRQSECLDKVCCPVSNNKYETLTSVECSEKRNEYIKKQDEEYLKKRNEEHQRALDEHKKINEEYEAKLNKRLMDQADSNDLKQEKYNEQIELQYNTCVSDAKSKAYRDCAPRNTCDSWGFGSPSWVIEQETTKCKQIYGY